MLTSSCNSWFLTYLSSILFSSERILPSDRKTIKDKIRLAFKKKALTYDDLLDLCSTIGEKRVFESAPTKLDYYKNGILSCKTIFELSDLGGKVNGEENDKNDDTNDDVPRGLKCAKTQH
jgi:hypothetical protein